MRLNNEQIEHLQTLERGGRLTPEEVVADARKKSSVLHGLFEWDVKAAADAYQLLQAAAVIRSVKVVITTSTREFRIVRYISDPAPPPRGYQPFELMSDAARVDAIVVEARRATGHMRRAANLAEAAGLGSDLTALVDGWTRWVDTIDTEVPLRTAAD